MAGLIFGFDTPSSGTILAKQVSQDNKQTHKYGHTTECYFKPLFDNPIPLNGIQTFFLKKRSTVTLVMMMMVVVLVFLILFCHCFYFRILYMSEVREIRMLVAVNQSVVEVPMLELRAFTLLGSTYTISFC